MKKIHIEIMKTLDCNTQEYGRFYDGICHSVKMGKYGMNEWNFTKALCRLVKLGYVIRVAGNDTFWYSLTKKGSEYLRELKKVKER